MTRCDCTVHTHCPRCNGITEPWQCLECGYEWQRDPVAEFIASVRVRPLWKRVLRWPLMVRNYRRHGLAWSVCARMATLTLTLRYPTR